MKKHYEIKDPKAPATRGQLWYLHCLTGEDTRNSKLTKGEAFTLIKSLKNGKASTSAGAGAPARKGKPTKDEQLPEKLGSDGSMAVPNKGKKNGGKTSARKPQKATEKPKKAPKQASPSKDKGKGKNPPKSNGKSKPKDESSHPLADKIRRESSGADTAKRLGAVVI